LQEYRSLYEQVKAIPAEKLAPHGNLLWRVPDSGFETEQVNTRVYGIRLQALLKSGDVRKITAGRDEMLRKLGQLR